MITGSASGRQGSTEYRLSADSEQARSLSTARHTPHLPSKAACPLASRQTASLAVAPYLGFTPSSLSAFDN